MSTPPTAPTQGAAQPDLTDEEIAELRRVTGIDYPVRSTTGVVVFDRTILVRLLAEVKRRRALVPPAAEPLGEQREMPEECPRCSRDGTTTILRSVLSTDGSAWEADHCDACGGNWFHDPPRSPSEIPAPAAPAGQQPTPPDEPVNPGWCHERHPMWPKYIYCGRNMPCSDHPQEQLGRKEGAPTHCRFVIGAWEGGEKVRCHRPLPCAEHPQRPTTANPTAEPERKP